MSQSPDLSRAEAMSEAALIRARNAAARQIAIGAPSAHGDAFALAATPRSLSDAIDVARRALADRQTEASTAAAALEVAKAEVDRLEAARRNAGSAERLAARDAVELAEARVVDARRILDAATEAVRTFAAEVKRISSDYRHRAPQYGAHAWCISQEVLLAMHIDGTLESRIAEHSERHAPDPTVLEYCRLHRISDTPALLATMLEAVSLLPAMTTEQIERKGRIQRALRKARWQDLTPEQIRDFCATGSLDSFDRPSRGHSVGAW